MMTSICIQRPAAAVLPRSARRSLQVQATATGSVINTSIEKDKDKVVTNVSTNAIEKQAVYCRCWKSGTFPLCNGAHNAHNKETGDNVGPLIVKKDE